VIINKLYCIGLNIDIGLKYLFMVIPLIYLTEALPITINGLGVREGAFVFFLSQEGYTKEEALGLALLVITMRYLFSLTIGGSLFLKVILFKKEADNSVYGTKMKKPVEIIS
jgi:glycosyltransferase 2 family protein